MNIHKEVYMNPKVLIIIPAYNESENIERVVDNLIENYPQYDLYLRRTECLPAWEINLCAVKK